MGKEGRLKLKGKKIKWSRSEGGKGIKNKRERKKKAKKGREEKGTNDSTEKIAKLRKKGEGSVREGSLDILTYIRKEKRFS